MAEICKFPDEAAAGLTFQAQLIFDDYPATLWSLAAVIRGPQSINIAAVQNGVEFDFLVDAATTAAWTPGRYWVSLQASQPGMVQEVYSGELIIKPNLSAIAVPYDGRTQNEIALDAINAVIANRATQDQMRYRINNRELWRTPIPELITLHAFYAAQVRREKRTKRPKFGRPIHVRFQ